MRRIASAVVAVAVVLAASLVLGTCSSPRNALRQPDPEIVQSVTTGIVSRQDPIRVTFTQPVAEGEIGATLERSPFRFAPRIRGTARWIDDRTLEFASDGELPAGRRVRVSVDLPKLAGFDFAFTVVAPSYTVDVGQLETADDAGTYRLAGTIRTSDREESAKVERILSARLASGTGRAAPLPVAWSHDEAGLGHSFTVTGIARAAEPGSLELAWSGKPIAAKTAGRLHRRRAVARHLPGAGRPGSGRRGPGDRGGLLRSPAGAAEPRGPRAHRGPHRRAPGRRGQHRAPVRVLGPELHGDRDRRARGVLGVRCGHRGARAARRWP